MNSLDVIQNVERGRYSRNISGSRRSRTVVESKTHSVKVHIHLCCMGKTMGIRLMEEEFISSERRPNSNQPIAQWVCVGIKNWRQTQTTWRNRNLFIYKFLIALLRPTITDKTTSTSDALPFYRYSCCCDVAGDGVAIPTTYTITFPQMIDK